MVKRKKVLAVLTALVACTSFSVFAAAPYTDLGGRAQPFHHSRC